VSALVVAVALVAQAPEEPAALVRVRPVPAGHPLREPAAPLLAQLPVLVVQVPREPGVLVQALAALPQVVLEPAVPVQLLLSRQWS
jgi:hypothetical protein